jgi:hypothetical protein
MINESATQPATIDLAAMEDLAKRFVRGMLGDPSVNIAEMFAPNAMGGHIYDDPLPPLDVQLVFVDINPIQEARLKQAMPDYVQDPSQVFWGDQGFVTTASYKDTLRDGTKVNAPFGVLYTVKDGLITSSVVYPDRQQLDPLHKVFDAIEAEEPWQKLLDAQRSAEKRRAAERRQSELPDGRS